ncbi:hypothetical protein V493_04784 [Pseudogymnoascus sp. VKM F-4281 (FW-2241)]|nr:hypothetical protein V493_04784 [Pseudogymnoascus sp. VKM F-4281 (FW-2241)]
MGSYKAYLEQGLDLCPKIYLPDDREPQTQHVDYPELPDDVRQGTQFAYERKATLNTPTHASQGQDIGPTRDFIAPLRIPTRPTQDTDSAHDFIAPSSIPTRPSQDTPSNNRTPSNSRSNPRSNSLSSHQSHLSRPDPLHSQSLNSKDSNPFPPPAPPQPRSPCYKPLWSKVTRAPPPPSPRTTGLWTNGLRSSTATPPLAPDAVELEASRPDGLFARRRKSFVPLA